eukprot:CAMPEP_0119053956 /NCGR_PEP_ID=MMETSP1177-20130426/74756_1 /TAXON_ID=2985 /ORGANISM="Ochromonas sp, Strain CCMP1899" /LENGTH=148 /DNA_ID=CAMNT_0007034047 /DNA_START=949 /DNA_END=1395 /DNA_ORIENTATION=-
MRIEVPVTVGSDFTAEFGSDGPKGSPEYEVLEQYEVLEESNANTVKADINIEEKVNDSIDNDIDTNKEGLTVEELKQVNMDINGINYSFQYPPSLNQEAAAQSMADQFCREHAAEIGIDLLTTTLEALGQTCTTPLASGLLKTMIANE